MPLNVALEWANLFSEERKQIVLDTIKALSGHSIFG
jgi:hypothetical protein